MMVYDPRAGLMQDNQLLGNGALQATNQQINFTVSYQGLQVLNPMEMIHVVIRQNQLTVSKDGSLQ